MLHIKDINTLRITKVKDWAIYFNVDNKSYLLHESSDAYESYTSLYEKINDEYGNYTLNHIKGTYYKFHNFKPILKNGNTYSKINKYEFVFKLVKYELAKTNDDAIKLLIKQNNKLKEIHKLTNKIEQLSRC